MKSCYILYTLVSQEVKWNVSSIHEQLLYKKLISEEQIKEIQEKIVKQYPSSTPKDKARLLAKTIHDKIDEALPDFSSESKKKIRMALIQQNLSANSFTITAQDVVENSIEMTPLVKEELVQWIRIIVEEDKELVQTYLNNLLQNSNDSDAVISQSVDASIQRGKRNKNIPFLLGTAAFILGFMSINLFISDVPQTLSDEKNEVASPKVIERPQNELPSYLQYTTIDDVKLKVWLNGRNSMLVDEPYFSTIVNVAQEFNIHPLLLFAITGQEQGFVSRDHQYAKKIANNPFNVFHSWEEYNTNIEETTKIAARTIVNLSKDRPSDVDPIQWINRKYAEDENWWLGVSSIFRQLKEETKP